MAAGLSWKRLEAKFPFALSLVAEEIGQDLERTLFIARELGIREIELGSLWGRRIDAVPLDHLVRARDALEEHGMKVRVMAPVIFKSVLLNHLTLESIDRDPHFQEEFRLFQISLEAARFFDAPLVRVFSFRRDGMLDAGNPSPRLPEGGEFPEEVQEKVARALSLACVEAEKAGVTLALENVRSCWGDSGRNTAIILERVDSPLLKVTWDPANAFVCGEEDGYPAGYRAVKNHIVNVHVKDAVVEDAERGLTRWERIGDGAVGWQGQLAALRADGYAGCLSIETHWSPPGGDPETNTRGTCAGLMSVLDGIAG